MDRRGFRIAVYGSFVAAMLVLGAVYFGLERQPDVTTWLLVGGEQVRSGLPAAVRVSARTAQGREPRPARVASVTLDGRPVEARIRGESPAIVHFDVPEGLDRTARLALEVEDDGQRDRLEAEIVVLRAQSQEGLPGAPPEALPPTERPLRVDVLPEAGVLAAGMDNDVFVRVRRPDGTPQVNATVRVAHPTLPDGAVTRRTDASGLARVSVVADQPSLRLKITATAGEATVQLEELLYSYGRQLLLRPDPPVARPGEAITVTLKTWERDPTVICDLLDQQVLVWSERVRVGGHDERLSLAPLPRGTYRLQCYDHPLDPGETFATTPIVVDEAPPLEALTQRALRSARVHPTSAVAPDGTDLDIAAGYWLAMLREPPQSPRVLASTRERALADMAGAQTGQKARVLGLMGGVFLVMLLFLADGVARNVRETRARMRAFAEEEELEALAAAGADGALAAPDVDLERLSRTRGLVLMGLGAALLVLNAVAFIWLMAIYK